MAEIKKLKRRAAKLYRSIRSRADNADCRNSLSSYISPDHEKEQRELDIKSVACDRSGLPNYLSQSGGNMVASKSDTASAISAA